jgi:cation transport ATPase
VLPRINHRRSIARKGRGLPVGPADHVHQFRDLAAMALSSVSVIATALRLSRARLD